MEEPDHLPRPLPGELDVPVLHGPVTPEEQLAIQERTDRQKEKETDALYKERQLSLSESANRAAWWNTRITWVLAIFTAISAVASMYQGIEARRSADSSEKAANAAKDAVDIAGNTLRETQLSNKRQADLSEESLRSTIDNFRQDQRPYILVSKFETVNFQDGQPINVNYDTINYGRSPAFHVREVQQVFFGPGVRAQNVRAQIDKFFRQPSGLTKGEMIGGSIIPPGVFSDPADRHFSTAKSSRPLKPGESAALMRQGDLYVLAGRIKYSDAYNRSFHTDFCVEFLSNSAPRFCPTHNAVLIDNSPGRTVQSRVFR